MKIRRLLLLLATIALAFVLVALTLASANLTALAAYLEKENDPVTIPIPLDLEASNAPIASSVVVQVNYAHDWIYAETDPNEAVTATVSSAGQVFTIMGQADDGGGFRSWEWPWEPYQPNLQPGDAVTVAVSGAAAVVNPVGRLSALIDGDSDTVSGTLQADWFSPLTLTVRCEIWVEDGPPTIEIPGVPADGGSFVCDFASVGWDILPGQDVAVRYSEPDGDQVINVLNVPWMRVNMADDWVGGNYQEDHTVWITVTDQGGGFKASAQLQTTVENGWGSSGFETNSEHWSPAQPDLQAGDWVEIRIDTGYTNVIQTGEITGALDLEQNTVSGTINAPWFTPTLTLQCGIWYWPTSPPDIVTSADPNGGSYLCDYDDVGWDLDYEQGAMVRYVEPDGDSVINVFVEHSPDLFLGVNYGHDWVEGQYEAGHTLWLTVTNSAGEVKATASGETGVIPWWGGQTGFSTNHNILWTGGLTPDIQNGDWVYGLTDNGYTSTVQLGAIDALADVDANTVDGTIAAPWFNEPLSAHCAIWEDGGSGVSFMVDPNDGAFTCNFSGAWDIIPGQTIGVMYWEPDGDQVINIAANPAPRLRLQTWGESQPGAGSNYSFVVQYRNEGSAPTENAVITATLAGGMTYLSDTSGLPVSGSGAPGDPLVWELGSLDPNPYHDTRFYLFAQVTAGAGEWITATVHIENGVPYRQDNEGDKLSQWSAPVSDASVDTNIGKGAWTWDPVPGNQFVYNVNVCNNGSTGSAQVTVTDTLPLSTTLVSWWGQYPGWEEVSSSPHELVVHRQTVPGNWCGEVYLLVDLDENAWPALSLNNQAAVYTGNDTDPGNNQTEIWHNVGYPHTNLGIDISWNWGMLVPGGEIRYIVNAYNNGNLPVSGVRITETLPASAVFSGSFWNDDSGAYPITPALVTDEIVVWEIGDLDNGRNYNFEIVLQLDPLAQPGLELVNTIDIAPQPGEDRYDDNTSTWTETLYTHGPNLRVAKYGEWHGHGEGHNAWYHLIVENVGDMPAEHITITDTLPASMTLEGDPNTDWSQVENYVRNDAEGWFSFTFSYLHPNWRRDIDFNVVNPSPDPIPGGLSFTNQVEIMAIAGEPTYSDNFSAYTLATGSDLYVQQTLVAGEILPGEVVTFSLLFGNAQVGHAWWWSLQGTAWLTDVLPAGSEFITATQRWCGATPWCPVIPAVQEESLLWELWPLGTGEWNEYYVTIRLPDTLTGMDTFISQAEIASDQPDVDIEVDDTNNLAVFTAPIELPYFTVDKTYVSSQVAGMPVTYTLTVYNLGNSAGTTVELVDWTPEWFTYGGGGSYDAGLVTWSMPIILPQGGSETAQFWGNLQCAPGGVVNNQYYRVAGSDQGITSTYGAPISFTIAAPNISASIQTSADTVLPNEMLTFTATAVTDGTPLTYTWDFGDGASAGGLVVTHTFQESGSFEVILTVTDGCGFQQTAAITIEVAGRRIFLPVMIK